jgi:hypothetical protein
MSTQHLLEAFLFQWLAAMLAFLLLLLLVWSVWCLAE